MNVRRLLSPLASGAIVLGMLTACSTGEDIEEAEDIAGGEALAEGAAPPADEAEPESVGTVESAASAACPYAGATEWRYDGCCHHGPHAWFPNFIERRLWRCDGFAWRALNSWTCYPLVPGQYCI